MRREVISDRSDATRRTRRNATRTRRVVAVLIGALLAAGLTAAALLFPGVRSPAAGPSTLAFVLCVPAFCTAMLLTGLDLPARVIVAGAAALTLDTAVAEVMLVCSVWSPCGGIVAVGAVSAVLALVAGLRRRRRAESGRVYPPGAIHPDDDDESWVFD